MSVKGKQREQTEFKKELYVGFAAVRVVAINPTRAELNKILGKESEEDEKELTYLTQDQESNDRLRLVFWLYNEDKDKYFAHSFNLINKERQNKDKDKVQIVNSTCTTSWVPYVEGTDKVNEKVIQDWFINFTDRDKTVVGQKKWRKAIVGEEELSAILRSWLGRLNFNDPDTEVLVDTSKLFKENYKELRSLIDGDYDTPFTVLIGVSTDENDSTKKYQRVWSKGYLPAGFTKYINKGNTFPSDYSKKTWKRFIDEVDGEYGFSAYHEKVPLTIYDETKDIAASQATKTPEPSSSEY